MKATYRCRLCGKVYQNGITAAKEMVELTMGLTPAGTMGTLPDFPPMTEPHRCGGGGLGVADFQGWEE